LYKIILFILLSTPLFSQTPGPTTNWYFGNQAGLSFNSGVPIALTNGVLSTTEGVATISDNSGNLLFYTNGVTVYNRLHLVMTNGTGLFGDVSSTQSSIIVQKPGSTDIYYIFTSDNDAGPNGICYSVVDMSLGASLGAVTFKNIQLHTPSTEKLCAVRHCNNEDVWVVSHDWNNNTFRTWLVDDLGVGSVNVWSNTGVTPSGITQSGYGQLKSSFDGKKLAACYYGYSGSGLNRLQIYDFDNSTGIVSNAQTLASDVGLYGCEFSPNGSVLYASTNQGLLIQFNLCANPIISSRYVVSNNGPFIGQIQLGPDGKIYVARNSTSLSVINNPNILGVGCGYSNLSLSLSGRSSSMGLPNFASYYQTPQIILLPPTIDCTTVSFTSPTINNEFGCNISPSYSYLWDFGDGTTSIESNPIHIYLSSGIYNVTLQISQGCSIINLNQSVNINSSSNVTIYTN
jgi:hypothetical protein